jgi:hypothetical protein
VAIPDDGFPLAQIPEGDFVPLRDELAERNAVREARTCGKAFGVDYDPDVVAGVDADIAWRHALPPC